MITSITILFLLCVFLLLPDKPFTDKVPERIHADQDHHYDQLYLEDLYLSQTAADAAQTQDR